jgi:hypothetical protein
MEKVASIIDNRLLRLCFAHEEKYNHVKTNAVHTQKALFPTYVPAYLRSDHNLCIKTCHTGRVT